MIEKNKKILAIVLLGFFLLYAGPNLLNLDISGVINPGFEGAKCDFYGAVFNDPDWASWTGSGKLWQYQNAQYGQSIVSGSGATVQLGAYYDNVYWSTYSTPNEPKIAHLKTYGLLATKKQYPELGIHVQSQIQLSDISRQGDPLHWNDTDALAGRIVEYWTLKAIKTSETSDKVTYSYEYVKQKMLVAPAEFWIGFYVDPAQGDNGGTSSGWREGEWHDVQCWFVLHWGTWNNAYQNVWEKETDDPEVNKALMNGSITSIQEPSKQFGIGFPIAAFIKGWEKAGWQSSNWESGAIYNPNETSPTWLQTRGAEQSQYSLNDLANLKQILTSKVSTSPGLVGDFLTIMDSPSPTFTYTANEQDFSDDSLTNALQAPDTRMKSTVYFPITLSNLGTYAEPASAVLGVPTSWRVYYPSVYYRVRILYGVIGTFSYLWTEEVAKNPLINYPSEIERVGTRVIQTPDVWSMSFGGIASWFANPFNQMWTFFIIMVIVLIVISVLNPGILTAMTTMLRRRREE